MLKAIKLCVIVLTLFIASSCSYTNPDPPYGVWESESPSIVMDVDPSVGDPISGQGQEFNVTYIPENGEPILLSVFFSKIDYQLYIGEFTIVCENGEKFSRPNYYFIGYYRIKDDKLTVSPSLQPETEEVLEKIVFTKTKQYEIPSSSEEESSGTDTWYGIEIEGQDKCSDYS